MIGVTLDSNIYFSALEFGGFGARFIGMARAGALRIDTSAAILDETVGVLRDKFGWDAYRLHFVKLELARLGNLVVPTQSINVTSDRDDNRVLECAISACSDFIITNDHHLLTLGQYEEILIIRPTEFFARAAEP